MEPRQNWVFWVCPARALFWKEGFGMQRGEKSKQRLTITFMVNAAGEKESAIVIWKAEKPSCFKGIDISTLPVKYFSQPNAWMTGEILDEVLSKLNRLSLQSRSIVLLMDNAGCHLRS